MLSPTTSDGNLDRSEGATAGLPSSASVGNRHCRTSRQWHPAV